MTCRITRRQMWKFILKKTALERLRTAYKGMRAVIALKQKRTWKLPEKVIALRDLNHYALQVPRNLHF